MGSSRISSVVFDQKEQFAATTLQVRESIEKPESGISWNLCVENQTDIAWKICHII